MILQLPKLLTIQYVTIKHGFMINVLRELLLKYMYHNLVNVWNPSFIFKICLPTIVMAMICPPNSYRFHKQVPLPPILYISSNVFVVHGQH